MIIKKILFILTLSIFLIFLSIFSFFYLINLPNDYFQEEVFLTIERGAGSKEIALILQEKNLIKSAFIFRAYLFFEGISGNLKAGDYLFSSPMTIPEIAEKIFKGEVLKDKIMIIEGWNIREIILYFEERGLVKKEDFEKIVKKDFSNQFDFLKDKPKELSLEGYLFPDTYEISINESPESILIKMLSNFDNKLNAELREKIKNKEKSIFEIIIIASLIEKEVRTFEDKRIVSGILLNRLKIGMPLQIDATIAYILEAENWSFSQMRREVALAKNIESSYNTYKYRGLPLGPISNPGIESIIAAIEPLENDYWYYLSTPQGETIFSKTLEEHNLAKFKYF